jgi:hypothetical protein
MTQYRRILRALIAIALGVLTTLAIAVACGLFLQVPYGPPAFRPPALQRLFIADGRPWTIAEFQRPGLTACWWSELTRDYFSVRSTTPRPREEPSVLIRDLIAYDAANRDPNRPPTPNVDRPSHWGQFARGGIPPERATPPPLPSSSPYSIYPPRFIGADFGYGWPCTALWFQALGTLRGPLSVTDSVAGAFVVDGSPEVRGRPECRVIPYWPVWTGLLIDSALYAALWWLLLVSLARARRNLRRRRNHCERCNYDLRATPPDQPCPECGQPRAKPI